MCEQRYLGLPVMLKAGEYSPNNPLVRGERTSGDVLLGLGEYERRRNTLRRIRQQQYREYLDQQAKKKQEAKEQAEKERREREEKEREREEREREREREEREREREEREREREERDRERRREAERRSPERRRASENYVGALSYSKVDSAVQVDRRTSPLSVAVQTDDSDLFRLPLSPTKSQLTQAERELSPHTVVDGVDRPIQPAPWLQDKWKDKHTERRRSYGDFDERCSSLVRKSTREKLSSELRHSYMPSIFDADAIQLRNVQAEKEAAARRQFYQQELKNQILEQQRIREERKTREKMLEQAEMRRLEEQLRMLRAARDNEVQRHQHQERAIKEDNIEYDKKRKELQKDIDTEQLTLLRAPRALPAPRTHSDTKLPFYYSYLQERNNEPPLLKDRFTGSAYFTDRTKDSSLFQERNKESSLFQERNKESSLLQERSKETDRKPFSTNIPDDSIFSPNYDVDGYLRRNLNFKAFEFKNKDQDVENVSNVEERVERALVHELPKVKTDRVKPIPKERKSLVPQESMDSLPIPVLRHSPVSQPDRVENGSELSDAMRKVDDKWKVPVVQKNILKSMPNDEGKNVSILTQLGSIRRQLQLEQLKLDRLSKDDDDVVQQT